MYTHRVPINILKVSGDFGLDIIGSNGRARYFSLPRGSGNLEVSEDVYVFHQYLT